MKQHLLSHIEIAQFCQELSLLLHAGVEPGSGLLLLAQDTTDPANKALLTDLTALTDEGLPLSEALKRSGAFPAYVSRLLYVGEQTGRTEEALSALSLYYQQQVRLERRLRSALLYPAVLMLVMVAVIVVLLTKVLPVFNDVYGRLGGTLTGLAGGLLAAGKALNAAMPLLCALLAVILVFLAVFSVSASFRGKLLARWQNRHGHRGLSKKLHTARFAQALAMGMTSGLTPEETLKLAAELLADLPLASRCVLCAEQLAEGTAFSKALAAFDLLPPAQCRLLEMGFRSGCGDSVMTQIAQQLAEDSDAALEARLSQIEPIMVLSTSILIGVILLSVMLPLLHIMSAIG